MPELELKFELLPVEEIEPWDVADGNLHLSWFALSLGYFWVVVDDQELFRYAQPICEHWRHAYPDATWTRLRYDDYQIERSWGTLLNMLPTILDPVPNDICTIVSDAEGWRDWQVRAEEWNDRNVEKADDVYYCALAWWRHRGWDAGYLANPPQFSLWRVADDIHIRWDNREITSDGIPVWEATQGEIVVAVREFLAAVESFHKRFMGEMGQRVDEIQACGGIPGVVIDLAALAREQDDRSSWLKPAIDPFASEVRRGCRWDEVRKAMRLISDWMAFPIDPLTEVSGKKAG